LMFDANVRFAGSFASISFATTTTSKKKKK